MLSQWRFYLRARLDPGESVCRGVNSLYIGATIEGAVLLGLVVNFDQHLAVGLIPFQHFHLPEGNSPTQTS